MTVGKSDEIFGKEKWKWEIMFIGPECAGNHIFYTKASPIILLSYVFVCIAIQQYAILVYSNTWPNSQNYNYMRNSKLLEQFFFYGRRIYIG